MISEKITYLDGLRGIACVVVVIDHFLSTFDPAMIYGSQFPSHLDNLEMFFWSTPILGIFYNGLFAVCIFFVLSGYVLTQKYYKTREQKIIISGAARRYIRLFVPVFAVIMLSFLLLSAGLYNYYIYTTVISAGGNYAHHWTFTPDIVDAIKQSVWGTFFVGGDIYYDPVLWTMRTEFFGSMVVFAIALLFGSHPHRWIIYLAMMIIFLNTYYLAFVIGLVFADMFNTGKKPVLGTSNNILLSIILIVGLFIGSYPRGILPADSMYVIFDNDMFQTPSITFPVLGAGMIMYILLNSNWLQNVLSSRIPVFLGKISYSMYLVHFLVISSFTCALFLILYPIVNYGGAVLIACFLSLFLIIPVSYLFNLYIDANGVELSKIVYNRFFKYTHTIFSHCKNH